MDVLFKNIRRVIMKNIGFTLVELLIVITIIATLSGIGYAVFGNATRSARDAKRKADLEQIRTALEMFKADNGRYPTNDASSTCVIDPSLGFNAYLASMPIDPKSTVYRYCYHFRTATTYDLCAHLEGVAGNFACGPAAYSCQIGVNSQCTYSV